jgi:hypothetical protein
MLTPIFGQQIMINQFEAVSGKYPDLFGDVYSSILLTFIIKLSERIIFEHDNISDSTNFVPQSVS